MLKEREGKGRMLKESERKGRMLNEKKGRMLKHNEIAHKNIPLVSMFLQFGKQTWHNFR